MCLIVVKPKGKKLPSEEHLSRWFSEHPDGFGLAYPCGEGKIRILKGAMTKPEMLRLVRKVKRELGKVGVKNAELMFHFRLATGGAIVPANCHPFPLTKNPEELGALDTKTDCAVAHNGIIYDYASYSVNSNHEWSFLDTPKTDTQAFIEDHLVDLGDSLWLPAVQKLIEAHTSSKFALMTPSGVVRIGEFLEDEGYYYSNGGFRDVKPLPAAGYSQPNRPFVSAPYEDNILIEGWRECSACGKATDDLYLIPEDDTPICRECFRFYEGREPTKKERWDYWKEIYGY